MESELKRASRFGHNFATIPVHAPGKPATEKRPNKTGLPDGLKNGIESLSGMPLDHVKVHYNSSKPAGVNALAYARGHEIHVAPGQEHHLPHEAWHLVQQAQGRVRATMQLKGGVPVNDDKGLEQEADKMGARAKAHTAHLSPDPGSKGPVSSSHAQGCGCPSCGQPSVGQRTSREPAQAQALQLRDCQRCGHSESAHKKKGCNVTDAKGNKCGCTSHSAKHDSGGKFDHGAGKRERRIAALKG
ncbi:MAG TPA: DUF4157 domain-containing protein [Thermoanaerobaculia bacterium]|nr:DUF4157 domain-containing protein [Thermoanaerobaculia bacterium]